MAKPAADERRSPRTNVLLAATLEWERMSAPVRVANLSANGALVFGDQMPRQDSKVTLACGSTRIAGHVAWAGDSHAGINFDEKIVLADILPKRGSGAHHIVKDLRKLDFRRPGLRGNQLTAEERRILANWKRERNDPD